jgi:hypothetical protein
MNTRGEMRDYIIPSCGTHVHGLEGINVRENWGGRNSKREKLDNQWQGKK